MLATALSAAGLSAVSGRRTLVFTTWTDLDFDRRARRVADALLESGSAGDRAVLLYPPGLTLIAAFFGCRYAQRVAVSPSPPKPSRLTRELPKLRSILESAAPHMTTTNVLQTALGALPQSKNEAR